MAEYTRNEIEMQVKLSETVAKLADSYNRSTTPEVQSLLFAEMKRLTEEPISIVRKPSVTPCPHQVAGDCL